LAEGLSYLLARLGIYSYLRKNDGQYKVTIPSNYERIYYEKIGFCDSIKKEKLSNLIYKKTGDREFSRHGRVPTKPFIDAIKKAGISKNEVSKKLNTSYNRLVYYDTISKPFAKGIIKLISENKINKEQIKLLNWLVNCNQEFVKIKSVNVINNKEKLPVYDIELEPCKFFIAGNKPMNVFDTIRKFTKEPWSPVQLVDKGTVSAEILAYAWMCIEYENSFMVVGGTGSGKTSFLNAVAFFIPPQARVVSIEDTRELSLEHENWLPSVSRAGVGLTNILGQRYGEVSLFDLLKESFRQRPDYIIVGEVRGAEAYILFQGMASGHPSMGTMHAENVQTMIRRLKTPPINLSGSLVMSVACVFVQAQTKVKGKEVRRMASVDEIVDVKEGDVEATINNIFKWDPNNDSFIMNPNSKVFDNIALHYAFTKEQVNNEFRLRTNLLKELLRRRIVGFKEVQKIIQEYYKDPANVLRRFALIK
jgi:type IV secretory pathway ATPase VirB11/archaellum biosynthesis ATPase